MLKSNSTEFEYLKNFDKEKYPLHGYYLLQYEICFQIKRIADTLEGWTTEGALGTFECNSKK